MAQENNYVLGRGRLFFDKFIGDTLVGDGERYFGNTPALSTEKAVTNLDHFNSDEGLRVKDLSIVLQEDMTLKFQCDNISAKNLADWFGGQAATESQALSVAAIDETFAAVKRGLYYQVGKTESQPQGEVNLTEVTVQSVVPGVHASGTVTFADLPTADDTITINGHVITFKASGAVGQQVNIGVDEPATAQALRAYINATPATGVTATGAAAALTLTAIVAGTAGNAITLAKSGTNPTLSGATLAGGTNDSTAPLPNVDGVNYEVDAVNGRIFVKDDAPDITDGDSLTVSYKLNTAVITTVIEQGQQIFGALRFISANATGGQKNYFWPYVKVTSDGEFALKGDDWQVMSFTGEVLKKDANTRRVYITAPQQAA